MITEALVNHFAAMTADNAVLYTTDTDRDELWNIYLSSFAPENNPIYRVRSTHDCSACRQFIKAIGNVVTIKDGKVISIWDFESPEPEYIAPIAAMSAYVKSKPICDVFYYNAPIVGTRENRELIDDRVIRYEHFSVKLNPKYVRPQIASAQADWRGAVQVFERTMKELSLDAMLTVQELIKSNTLYKGQEWEYAIDTLISLKREHDALNPSAHNVFYWEKSIMLPIAVTKIKNHSIGVLLSDIADGMDLDAAVKRYEKIVAPTNYKRPKPVYTTKMLEAAKKTVDDLGYMQSLERRYAHINDIAIQDILFVDRTVAPALKNADIFGDMKADVGVDVKKFSKIDEIPINKFIEEVLPHASGVELLFENKHASKMVSLITAVNDDSKSLFKWNNNFSWAYTGNMTDSIMRDEVKSAGGRVDGIMRFSIMWNNGSVYNANDMDAHCVEPDKHRIYFRNRGFVSPTGGVLDVDIIAPSEGKPAVENISWATADRLKDGAYDFYIHCYSHRGGNDGFEAEIEVDGTIHKFVYRNPVRSKEYVHVATVEYSRASGFNVISRIPSTASSRTVWGVTTQNFVPVMMVMKSPNCWNAEAVGHEHVFFMLKDCVNPEHPNGFYNEFLKQDLAVHRNVFEALGAKMHVDESSADNQLSGVGFSMTKRAEIIVRVHGQTERIMKVRL